MIEDLLVTAEGLARLDKTRPRQVSRRRAVSSAYYAAFHALLRIRAEALIGQPKGIPAAFARLYRALDHRPAKVVLRDFLKTNADSDLATFYRTFVSLQELRYEADYNPLPVDVSRQAVLDSVDEARLAIVCLKQVSPDLRLTLATFLLFKSRS